MPAEMHVSNRASSEGGKVKVISCSWEFGSFLSLRNQLHWYTSSQGGCFWLLHLRSPATRHLIIAWRVLLHPCPFPSSEIIFSVIYLMVYCLFPLSKMGALWEHQSHLSGSLNYIPGTQNRSQHVLVFWLCIQGKGELKSLEETLESLGLTWEMSRKEQKWSHGEASWTDAAVATTNILSQLKIQLNYF